MRTVMLVAFALLLVAAHGQDTPTLTTDITKQFEWRSIGPSSMGGRVSDIAVVESNPYIFYVGLATGGVLKTVNNGTTWEPVFDSRPVLSIGAVAVAPSNPDVVWVGTGEANGRNSSGWGNGVYRSTDAGKTWEHLGLDDTQCIGRILVDPENPDIAFVAATGHLWGYNKERGVYKTTDGGKTWQAVLQIDDKTGAIEMAFGEPGSGVVFAAMYQRIRSPWSFHGTGPAAGLYRSKDYGETWEKLAGGLPDQQVGRIGVAVSRSNPKVVVAVVESHAGGGGALFGGSPNGGVYRSEDGGDTWERVNPNIPRGFYFGQVRIDPQDEKIVYLLGTGTTRSTDGGKQFRTYMRRVHPDCHAMWIDPKNGDHALLGTDGGVYVTYDGGQNWDFLNNFPMGQFYEISFDYRDPFHVYGGLQDNGTWGSPNATRTTTGVNNADWYSLSGGDGFYVVTDPRDPNIVYAESQNGGVVRLDRNTGRRRNVSPRAPEGHQNFRFNWNTPLLISPHDPDVLYMGGSRLIKVTKEGQEWEAVSPDLSKMDGGKIMAAGSGAETYGTVVTISESPLKRGLIWCGTDDGNVQLTRDGGATWDNVGRFLPPETHDWYVSRIEASRFKEGTAYVSIDAHRSDNFEPHLFVTTDYGKTWRSVRGDLPEHGPIQTVRESTLAPGVLFVGTAFGCFMSGDGGGHWVRLMQGLPPVEVDDLQIHPRDHALIAATHGRSIYILDNVAPLEEMTPEVMGKDLHLFTMPPAAAFNRIPGPTLSNREFIAANPPAGARVYFWLKEAPRGQVRVSVTGPDGKTVFEQTVRGAAGLNSVPWNLRLPPEEPAEGGQGGEGRGGGRFGQGAQGEFVEPGEYKVTVTAGDKSATTTLTITGTGGEEGETEEGDKDGG